MSIEKYKILIVDDVMNFHTDVQRAFWKKYDFEGAIGIYQLWKKLEEDTSFDLILLDLVLESTGEKIGLTLIKEIQEKCPGIPIIVVTNEKDYQTAADSIKLGAKNFLYKGDYNYEEWDKMFRETIEASKIIEKNEALEKENKILKFQHGYVQHPDYPIIGRSAQIEKLRRTLKIAAGRPDLTVLITGETGVGKSIAAHFLHYNSVSRKNKGFEEIFISNIPQSLLEGELFGALKGSYTDLKETRTGRLALADGGIVFLDEIGDLDLKSQGKLLQFLQKKTIRPLGGKKDIEVDIQVVAATNKVLEEEVAEGSFRKDLFERLKVFPIHIPPLRQRREDITILMLHFLGLNSESDLKEIFDQEVLDILKEKYDWSGNVRELENALQSMELNKEVENTSLINFRCLPDTIKNFLQHKTVFSNGLHSDAANGETANDYPNLDQEPAKTRRIFETLREIERALEKKNGVKSDAATMLGWNSSDDIRYRVKKLKKNHAEWIEYFPRIKKSYKL